MPDYPIPPWATQGPQYGELYSRGLAQGAEIGLSRMRAAQDAARLSAQMQMQQQELAQQAQLARERIQAESARAQEQLTMDRARLEAQQMENLLRAHQSEIVNAYNRERLGYEKMRFEEQRDITGLRMFEAMNKLEAMQGYQRDRAAGMPDTQAIIKWFPQTGAASQALRATQPIEIGIIEVAPGVRFAKIGNQYRYIPGEEEPTKTSVLNAVTARRGQLERNYPGSWLRNPRNIALPEYKEITNEMAQVRGRFNELTRLGQPVAAPPAAPQLPPAPPAPPGPQRVNVRSKAELDKLDSGTPIRWWYPDGTYRDGTKP